MKNITQDFILDYVVYTATTSITFKEHFFSSLNFFGILLLHWINVILFIGFYSID
jgi:hypothetical protein